MEAMQAVLLVVIGVLVVLALYFVASQFIASTPAPDLQLDPYGSTLYGTNVVVTLKAGNSIDQINKVEIYDPRTGSFVCSLTTFTPSASNIRPGETVTASGTCQSQLPRGIMYQVRVTYTVAGKTKVVVLNWQT